MKERRRSREREKGRGREVGVRVLGGGGGKSSSAQQEISPHQRAPLRRAIPPFRNQASQLRRTRTRMRVAVEEADL